MGQVNNNNVVFAGKCFKILRTNDDMSIRIIFTGEETNNNICSGSFTNAPYVGNYAHWSGSNIYANSYTKVKIDEWYESNLDSYTYLLADNAFCNDVTYVENGGVFTYGANTRASNGKPSTICPENTDDIISTYKVSYNNLKYPVVIITADEMYMAGIGSNNNAFVSVNYLSTMSPSRSNGLYRVQWNNLNVSAGFQATGSNFYPVISLFKDITILPNSDGTKYNHI